MTARAYRIIKRIGHKPANSARAERYIPGVKPNTSKQWITLADDYVEHAKRSDTENINEFPLMHGYSPYKFKKWAAENEYFESALEQVRYILGVRREKWARDRSSGQDSQTIMKTYYQYDLDHRDHEIEKARKDQEGSQRIIAVIERAPSSDLVDQKVRNIKKENN